MRYMLCILLSILNISYSQADKLKAVIIVGDLQDRTVSAIKEMEEIHSFFKSKNMIVKTFYHPKTSWKEIISASKDASIFVYCGHGISWTGGKYGGLDLDRAISSEDILNDLKLKDNAIVIFQSVCGGAGSSASDDGDIGIKKALERVSDYSMPFLKIGASAYFSDNFRNGCLSFLNNFFEGKTIKECFDNSLGWSAKLESNGCLSIIYTNLTVGSSLNSSITQVGSVLESTVNGGFMPYSYLWSTLDTTEDINITSSGLYWLVVTDSLSCPVDTAYYNGVLHTSISDIGISDLNVYPNPSRDMFNIVFSSNIIQNIDVRVVNVAGEVIISEDLHQFVGDYTKQINLGKNAKGIYLLEIETNEGVINKKLILQ